MKTPAERREQQREEKLEAIKRDIRAGSLVVRQMTPAERAQYPPQCRPRRRS
jgi:anti-sigma28 factor (negative regulator of flagellin synthesis)